MNYLQHYEALIARARGRVLNCYKENHHVIPRCMGGSDLPENLVYLSGPEHFVAHQLLVKIHPETTKLIFALNRMAQHCNNNKIYGWIKERMAIEARKQKGHWLGVKQSPELIARRLAHRIGRKHSDETRQKMSIRAMGNKNAKGKKFPPQTPEHRAALSAARKGKKIIRTPEQRAAFSDMLRRRHAARREARLSTCERIAR